MGTIEEAVDAALLAWVGVFAEGVSEYSAMADGLVAAKIVSETHPALAIDSGLLTTGSHNWTISKSNLDHVVNALKKVYAGFHEELDMEALIDTEKVAKGDEREIRTLVRYLLGAGHVAEDSREGVAERLKLELSVPQELILSQVVTDLFKKHDLDVRDFNMSQGDLGNSEGICKVFDPNNTFNRQPRASVLVTTAADYEDRIDELTRLVKALMEENAMLKEAGPDPRCPQEDDDIAAQSASCSPITPSFSERFDVKRLYDELGTKDRQLSEKDGKISELEKEIKEYKARDVEVNDQLEIARVDAAAGKEEAKKVESLRKEREEATLKASRAISSKQQLESRLDAEMESNVKATKEVEKLKTQLERVEATAETQAFELKESQIAQQELKAEVTTLTTKAEQQTTRLQEAETTFKTQTTRFSKESDVLKLEIHRQRKVIQALKAEVIKWQRRWEEQKQKAQEVRVEHQLEELKDQQIAPMLELHSNVLKEYRSMKDNQLSGANASSPVQQPPIPMSAHGPSPVSARTSLPTERKASIATTITEASPPPRRASVPPIDFNLSARQSYRERSIDNIYSARGLGRSVIFSDIMPTPRELLMGTPRDRERSM